MLTSEELTIFRGQLTIQIRMAKYMLDRIDREIDELRTRDQAADDPDPQPAAAPIQRAA